MKEKIILKEINNYFNNYFKSKGWECTAAYDIDFSYDYANDIIYYSFIVSEAHDKLFKSICKSIQPELEDVDTFILSLFHEIGHYMTYYQFDETEWDKGDDDIERLEEKLKDQNLSLNEELKIYEDYYNLPIEIAATKWGCNYIVENVEEVNNLFLGLKDLAKKFIVELGFNSEEIFNENTDKENTK